MNHVQWREWLAEEGTQEFLMVADAMVSDHKEHLAAPGLVHRPAEEMQAFVCSTNGVINGIRALIDDVRERAKEKHHD